MGSPVTSALVWLALFATSGAALADWPMARHDPRRSATADGISKIAAPTAFWRFYAGGTLSSSALLAYGSSSASLPHLIVTTGGRAAARDPANGDIQWETPNR
jgi:hypothetical protein